MEEDIVEEDKELTKIGCKEGIEKQKINKKASMQVLNEGKKKKRKRRYKKRIEI